MILIYLQNINVCLNSCDYLIIAQLNVRKTTCKHHGRREVMFVIEECFRIDSKMISTGGYYLLFAGTNDIHLLNINVSATIYVLQSTNIRHRL